MTDNDFSKAFKQCLNNESCIGCPLDHNDYASDCVSEIFKYCSDLAKRKDEMIEGLIAGQETLQKYIAEKDAEIKRLKEDNFIKSQKRANIFEILNAHEKGRNEAVKEFAESVINDILPEYMKGHEEMALKISFAISQKAEEMVGEK